MLVFQHCAAKNCYATNNQQCCKRAVKLKEPVVLQVRVIFIFPCCETRQSLRAVCHFPDGIYQFFLWNSLTREEGNSILRLKKGCKLY